jgi:rSAM/selenodomain-associated transferase 2
VYLCGVGCQGQASEAPEAVGQSHITVVIPALNEEDQVAETICSVREEAEVIVVDGGSHDRTCEIAAAAGAKVTCAPRGRGAQLEAGARLASGAWIVFLHADTRLEQGWAGALRSLPEDVVGGSFRFALRGERRAYRYLEAAVALRCSLLRLPFGDQAIFVRRRVYDALGGIAPLPLMEDVEFAGRLRRAGRLAFLPLRALTSARRWEHRGMVGTTLSNLCLLGLFALGFPTDRLARMYGDPPRPSR